MRKQHIFNDWYDEKSKRWGKMEVYYYGPPDTIDGTSIDKAFFIPDNGDPAEEQDNNGVAAMLTPDEWKQLA